MSSITPVSLYAPKFKKSIPKDNTSRLIIVVDTEEEFDWSAGPCRESVHVTHFERLHRFHDICVKHGIKPVYVVDYPVVSQTLSSSILKTWHDKGECVIGAHLHPWVNPPFTESLSVSNMYPGNLSYEEEFCKLKSLTDKIVEVFGFSPSIYKAGRYGFGPNTAKIMSDLGYSIDLSFSPSFDMSSDGGGDHRTVPPTPFFLEETDKEIFCIPGTGAVVGFCPQLFEIGQLFEWAKAPGILSRLGAADRLKLSPELYSNSDHKKIVNFLLKKSVNTFSFTLHSSTVMPGGSPYVKNEADVSDFLKRCDEFFHFFLHEVGGVPSTPLEIRQFHRK